jgi:2-polyprenyl-6-hydroxyphenyl methylase/3-demethylubiquinone-9 3-methyltransferase
MFFGVSMDLNRAEIEQWHRDEEAWWNKHGAYMRHQWELTPKMNKVLRGGLEVDCFKFLSHPGQSLLDVGCGGGLLSSRFAEQGMRVLGLDVSKEQIAAANEIKKIKQLSNLEYQCEDLMRWQPSSRQEQFDNVFMNAFLHHLPPADLQGVFQRIDKVLKPGGRVYLYEPLRSTRGRRLPAKTIDWLIGKALAFFIVKMPSWLSLLSDRHRQALQNGYAMSSPHERPIEIDMLKSICSKSFEIIEVRGWHLHSIGFAMNAMGLKEFVRVPYARWATACYLLDQWLLRIFSWEEFSGPDRFILCSVKMKKK